VVVEREVEVVLEEKGVETIEDVLVDLCVKVFA
jgi:hypothetical protein